MERRVLYGLIGMILGGVGVLVLLNGAAYLVEHFDKRPPVSKTLGSIAFFCSIPLAQIGGLVGFWIGYRRGGPRAGGIRRSEPDAAADGGAR